MFLVKVFKDPYLLNHFMDYLILSQMIDYGLKFYSVARPTPLGSTEAKVMNLEILCLNLGFSWLKFFKDAYHLNSLMDLLYTFTDIRKWSKVLFTIIFTLLCDLEIKVIHLEISC